MTTFVPAHTASAAPDMTSKSSTELAPAEQPARIMLASDVAEAVQLMAAGADAEALVESR